MTRPHHSSTLPAIGRRAFLRNSAAGVGALALPTATVPEAEPTTVINPIVFQRADPQILSGDQGRCLFTAPGPSTAA